MRAVGAIGLALAILVGGCHERARRAPSAAVGNGVVDGAAAVAAPAAAGTAPALAGDWASPLGDASLYDLELTVRTADGTSRTLASLRGAPVLIAMFYASCPAACPRLIDDLKGIEAALEPDVRERTQIVLVSFDAARDTPAALRTLAEERHLGPRWLLAAADDGTARELAAALGVKYRVLDSGEFFHTSVITALDADGQPLARAEGLGRGADVIIAALR